MVRMNEQKEFKDIQHRLMAMKGRIVKSLGEKRYVEMLQEYYRFKRGGDYTNMPRHPKFIMAEVIEQMVLTSKHWDNYIQELEERNKLMGDK